MGFGHSSSSISISNTLFFSSLILLFAVVSAQAQPSFRCLTAGATCNSLAGYIPPNATTLSALITFFNVTDLNSILGANNLPPSTPPSHRIVANSTIVIPFRCTCNNGTGAPTNPPIYTVVPGDGLDHIARNVFAGLIKYEQIQAFNGIPDPNRIDVGQRLRIPLPCSCDQVDGKPVVHYAHVVAAGSSLPEIARQFNTSEFVLQTLNNLTDPKALQAGVVLDVPLPACSSIIRNDSQDFPSLLLSSGTSFSTARNCITCQCNTATSLRLQCERSQVNSSFCSRIGPCDLNGGTLNFGNTTTIGCNRTTCAYAGFNNQTIFTAPDTESTCPAPPPPPPPPLAPPPPPPSADAISLRGRTATWNGLPVGVFIHALLLCIVFFFSGGHT